MNQQNTLIYLNNLISNYTFLCKKDTAISRDIKKINIHIQDFKNNNFNHSDIFISDIIKLSQKNHDSLFDSKIFEYIKTLNIDINTNNTINSYDVFFTSIEKEYNPKSTFTTINLIEIPNSQYTVNTNDVLIHQNYLNQYPTEKINNLQQNPTLLKDFYLNRLADLNQSIEFFTEETNINLFNINPPTIILSYDSKKNIEYNGVLRKNNNTHNPLIEITLNEEGLGTISHELFHLLEYEYTKLKYPNLNGKLISNHYYNQDLTSQQQMEDNDSFLKLLKNFNNLDNKQHSPITKQDKLTILDEFLKEHAEEKLNINQYNINNPNELEKVIEILLLNIQPNLETQPKKILDFQDNINHYLKNQNTQSFFAIESLLYDQITNENYSNKYSEKLARLSGLYFDENYQSKPLPRGKEKEIYIHKFNDILIALKNETNKLQENSNPSDEKNNNGITEKNFNKDIIIQKLYKNRHQTEEHNITAEKYTIK